MPGDRRQRLGLPGLTRGIADMALLLAAFTSASEQRTVVAVGGVGLGLWAIDLVRGRVPDEADARRGRAVVIVAFAAMLALELTGLSLSLRASDSGLLLFYATVSAFQVAAIVTTLVCGPDDMSLVAWGACHGAIAFAAAVSLLSEVGPRLANRPDSDPLLVGLVLSLMTTLSLLFLAMAFLLLLAAIALGALQEPHRRRRAWMSLMLAQAAMLVIFLRWPWNRP